MTTTISKRDAGYVAKASAAQKKDVRIRAEQRLADEAHAAAVERTASPSVEDSGFEQASSKSTLLILAGGAVAVGGGLALGGGGSAQTVAVANHAPTITMVGSTTTNVGQAVMVPFTASDPDGNPLTFAANQPAHGAVSIANGAASYTPNPGFVGTDVFTAVVTDTGGLTATKAVTVVVKDTAIPVFSSADAVVSIQENAGDNKAVFTAAATDATALTYSLKAGGDSSFFAIDAKSGVVTLNTSADYETKPVYNFVVVASDASNNSSEQAVRLNILDVAEGGGGGGGFNQQIYNFNVASDHLTLSVATLQTIDGFHGWPFNFADANTFSTLITMGATATNGDGGDLFIWTGNNTVDTEAEVDTLMSQMTYTLGQMGPGAGEHSGLILTDDGVNTYLWADAHLSAPEQGMIDTITLVATFYGVADCSTFTLGNFTIVA